ncbi:MAG: TonB-dependent receptor plug domain-containing protein [Lewinellaceae bacterium]|nr:TonB-dependent receptor plug domain-containing protein [Lewinellaceae bacterium]
MPATNRSLSIVHVEILKNVAWTWLVCFLCVSAQGQQAASAVLPVTASGSIEGTIRDAETGEALPLASVRLLDAPFGGMAEPTGDFRLTGLPAGTYTLVASYLGYQDFVAKDVEVVAGQRHWIAMVLQPVALPVGEVVVTASLRSQAIKLAPASIGVISNKQLQERRITTFDQAFDDMPGVVVTRSGGANVQAFSIRGASEVAGGGIGNRVLLLIDGRPALSPESGGALWNLVPLSSIERIEVVRGAYSSLYGSSAMGGVVNVITRQADAVPQTRLHLNYGAYNHAPQSAGYRRYNDFHSVDISHSRQAGKFSWLLDGSWKSDDGHKEKTGFDLYNFFGKTTWAISPRRTLQLSANANRMYSDAPATWLSKRQAYSAAEFKQDDYQDRREFNADLYYAATPNDRIKYAAHLPLQFLAVHFRQRPGNDGNEHQSRQTNRSSSTACTRRLGNVAGWNTSLSNLFATSSPGWT